MDPKQQTTFTCELCGKVLSTKWNLSRHLLKCHGAGSPYHDTDINTPMSQPRRSSSAPPILLPRSHPIGRSFPSPDYSLFSTPRATSPSNSDFSPEGSSLIDPFPDPGQVLSPALYAVDSPTPINIDKETRRNMQGMSSTTSTCGYLPETSSKIPLPPDLGQGLTSSSYTVDSPTSIHIDQDTRRNIQDMSSAMFSTAQDVDQTMYLTPQYQGQGTALSHLSHTPSRDSSPQPSSHVTISVSPNTEQTQVTCTFSRASSPMSQDLGLSQPARCVQQIPSKPNSGLDPGHNPLFPDPGPDEPQNDPSQKGIAGRKRKLSYSTASRPYQSLSREPIPSYEVKASKKIRGQIRAAELILAKAKSEFEHIYEGLLARWGVKRGHTGTCVLFPQDYRSREPLDIMSDFLSGKYPRAGADRASIQLYGHGTTVARAVAWFYHCKRRGIDLDNFIDCGPFKRMDASHTCHHEYCIIHITWEDTDTNRLSRIDCCTEARRLRQEGKEVPEYCSQHRPPCLMQVSNSRL